jgi:hypothetical protein
MTSKMVPGLARAIERTMTYEYNLLLICRFLNL